MSMLVTLPVFGPVRLLLLEHAQSLMLSGNARALLTDFCADEATLGEESMGEKSRQELVARPRSSPASPGQRK